MKIRQQDDFGAGYFGAPRDGGKRTHNGIDIVCKVGQKIECLNAGTVTKLGYAYEDDLSYRYIQLTDTAGAVWRYFYIEPSVRVGQELEAYSELGEAQDLGKRYNTKRKKGKKAKKITPHFHLEIKRNGVYIDPTFLVGDL